jgi:hypothetical protein
MLTSGPSTSEFIFICLPSRARKQGIDELWVVEMNFMRIDAHYWACIRVRTHEEKDVKFIWSVHTVFLMHLRNSAEVLTFE